MNGLWVVVVVVVVVAIVVVFIIDDNDDDEDDDVADDGGAIDICVTLYANNVGKQIIMAPNQAPVAKTLGRKRRCRSWAKRGCFTVAYRSRDNISILIVLAATGAD